MDWLAGVMLPGRLSILIGSFACIAEELQCSKPESIQSIAAVEQNSLQYLSQVEYFS